MNTEPHPCSHLVCSPPIPHAIHSAHQFLGFPANVSLHTYNQTLTALLLTLLYHIRLVISAENPAWISSVPIHTSIGFAERQHTFQFIHLSSPLNQPPSEVSSFQPDTTTNNPAVHTQAGAFLRWISWSRTSTWEGTDNYNWQIGPNCLPWRPNHFMLSTAKRENSGSLKNPENRDCWQAYRF